MSTSHYILYGSEFSPFVRRIRISLWNKSLELRVIDLWKPEVRQEFLKISPVLKIPVLVDGDQAIYDSRVIQRYLSEKENWPKLNWDDENLLTVIDGLADSCVQLLTAKRSQVEIPENTQLGMSHKERIPNSLAYLEMQIRSGAFACWGYPAICLFATLDWIHFRQLYDLSKYPELSKFRDANSERAETKESDPRRTKH